MKVGELLRPYRWQKQIIKNQRRYNVVVGPRQHGKTTLLCHLARETFLDESIQSPCISFCADSAARIFRAYSEYMNYLSGPYGMKWNDEKQTKFVLKRPFKVKRVNPATGKEELVDDYGSIHIFGGLTNYFGPKGLTNDLVLLDEYGLCPRGFLYESIMPSTDHTEGPIFITGTVEPNHYQQTYDLAKDGMKSKSSPWYAFYFQFRDKFSREVHTERRLKDIEARYDMNDPLLRRKFLKEYMCIWEAGLEGTPFSLNVAQHKDKGLIGSYPHNPNYPVNTSWDDGLGCTAIWFWQAIGGRFVFINYMEWLEASLHKICGDINKYFDSLSCTVGCHVFAHTARQRNQSDNNLMKLSEDIIRRLGYEGWPVVNRRPKTVDSKIRMGREFFAKCTFDDMNCRQGIRCLSNFKRQHNAKKGIRGKETIKDDYSHGAEAYCELAQAHFQGRFLTNSSKSALMKSLRTSYFKDLERI